MSNLGGAQRQLLPGASSSRTAVVAMFIDPNPQPVLHLGATLQTVLGMVPMEFPVLVTDARQDYDR